MNQRPGKRGPKRSRALLAAAAVVAIAAATTAAIAFASSGGGAITSNKAEIRSQLAARLHSLSLKPVRIACVKNGRRFQGVPVIRCNVDYGAPHIYAVCAVLRGGKLITNSTERLAKSTEPAIPCGPDKAGWHSPIETFR